MEEGCGQYIKEGNKQVIKGRKTLRCSCGDKEEKLAEVNQKPWMRAK